MTGDPPPADDPDEHHLVVDVSVTVAASRERVWRALTDAADRAEWWHDLDLEVTVGGKLEERWTDDNGLPMITTGRVTSVVPARELRLSWADPGWSATTDVQISLEAAPTSPEVTDRTEAPDETQVATPRTVVTTGTVTAGRSGVGVGTVVRIRESGWQRLDDSQALAADHRAGWRVHLTNLRRHLEP